jgi:hypothetical protein
MSTPKPPKPCPSNPRQTSTSTSLPNSNHTTLSQRHPLNTSAIPEALATRPPAVAEFLGSSIHKKKLELTRKGEMAPGFQDLSRKSQWIALAIMSGACAAFNGVFAKLYVTFFFSFVHIYAWGDEFYDLRGFESYITRFHCG